MVMAAVVGWLALFVVRQAWRDGWLLYDDRPGPALVIAKRSHGHRVYQYTVNGHVYTGDDQPAYNKSEQAAPYVTRVYFSASHPWISGLRPGELRLGYLPLYLMVLIAWSLFVTQGLVGWRAEWRAAGQLPDQASEIWRQGDDAAFRLWFPVGRSWWAVAAGYMGLFALYCVPVIGDMHQKLPGSVAAFVVLCLAAPLAIVLGAVAIADLRRKPELHGWGRAVFGLVMGSIFTSLLIGAIVSYAVGWSSQ
jgi:hypothetical protein